MTNVIKTILFSSLIALLAMVGYVLVQAQSVYAHDTGEPHEEVAQEAPEVQPSEDEVAEAPESYNYTAQMGDSYTKIARKAVQTFGVENEVNLSGAQIIFAETNLTQEAGSPLLLVGQEVSLTEDSVRQWVEAAADLSDEAETRWDRYVRFVDFNTDNVGEAKDES